MTNTTQKSPARNRAGILKANNKNNSTKNILLEAALKYAVKGIYVFPVEPEGKKPHAGLAIHGYKDASIDPDVINSWWQAASSANIGINLEKSNLVAIDIDVSADKNGDKEFEQFRKEHGNYPITPIAISGSGGQHVFLKAPPSTNFKSKLEGYKHIDIKHKGYVVAPPSVHESGKNYTWAKRKSGDTYTLLDNEVAEIPESWLPFMIQEHKPIIEGLDNCCDDVSIITRFKKYLLGSAPIAIEGEGGDNTTFEVACKGRDYGLSEEKTFELMAEHWNDRCSPSWEPEDLREKVNNAYKYAKNSIGCSSAEADFKDIDLTKYTPKNEGELKQQEKESIEAIRNEKKLKVFEKNRLITEKVYNYCNEVGTFYKNSGSLYFFHKSKNQLIELEKGSRDLKVLVNDLGVNPADNLYNYVSEHLILKAHKDGIETEINHFSYYDQFNNIIYLYSNDNRIYKITKDEIEQVCNGTDGVLFLSNSEHEPFKKVDIDHDKDYLNDLFLGNINFEDSVLTGEEQKYLLRRWVFTLFFESIMPTKALLAIIGEKGSGKTFTLKSLGKLLFGKNFEVMPMPEHEENFEVAITNNHFIAIDNADTKKRWLNDKLACLATGQKIRKRKLYTTNEVVEIPTKCFVGVTSRTPHFTRDDIADRLLIIKVTRLSKFKDEARILTDLLGQRNEFMSYMMYKIQRLLAILEETKNYDKPCKLRMADFGIFISRIAYYNNKTDELESIIDKLNEEQNNFVLENNPLFEALEILLDQNNGRIENIGSRELLAKLNLIVTMNDIKDFYFKNPRSLAQFLKNLKSNLAGCIEIETRKGHQSKMFYTFTKVIK